MHLATASPPSPPTHAHTPQTSCRGNFARSIEFFPFFVAFAVPYILRDVERRPVLCSFQRIEGGSAYQKKKIISSQEKSASVCTGPLEVLLSSTLLDGLRSSSASHKESESDVSRLKKLDVRQDFKFEFPSVLVLLFFLLSQSSKSAGGNTRARTRARSPARPLNLSCIWVILRCGPENSDVSNGSNEIQKS